MRSADRIEMDFKINKLIQLESVSISLVGININPFKFGRKIALLFSILVLGGYLGKPSAFKLNLI
jgi:hypothetical protein